MDVRVKEDMKILNDLMIQVQADIQSGTIQSKMRVPFTSIIMNSKEAEPYVFPKEPPYEN